MDCTDYMRHPRTDIILHATMFESKAQEFTTTGNTTPVVDSVVFLGHFLRAFKRIVECRVWGSRFRPRSVTLQPKYKVGEVWGSCLLEVLITRKPVKYFVEIALKCRWKALVSYAWTWFIL